MARKTMKKEVTHTKVKVGKIEIENGMPKVVELPEEILIGNVSLEKAQKQVSKKYDYQVTVFGVEPNTQVFEMAVEDFIKHAKLVVKGEGTEEIESEEDESEVA